MGVALGFHALIRFARVRNSHSGEARSSADRHEVVVVQEHVDQVFAGPLMRIG